MRQPDNHRVWVQAQNRAQFGVVQSRRIADAFGDDGGINLLVEPLSGQVFGLNSSPKLAKLPAYERKRHHIFRKRTAAGSWDFQVTPARYRPGYLEFSEDAKIVVYWGKDST